MTTSNHDEHILVIPRTDFFPHGAWHGLKQEELATHLAIIQEYKQFIPRSIAEHDPSYKQIIPYLIFMHKNSIFVMQRRSDASETRLRNKHSIGIGGHVREDDMQHGNSIFDWAQREFHEEVAYSGSITMTPLGILNDDSNAVGQVHAGLVLLINGSSDEISIRSELKGGHLFPLDQCIDYNDTMESWSKMVLTELLNRRSMVDINKKIYRVDYQ